MLARLVRGLPQVQAALRPCTVIHAHIEPYRRWPRVRWPASMIITGHPELCARGLPPLRRDRAARVGVPHLRRSCASAATEQITRETIPGAVRATQVIITNRISFARFGAIQPKGGAVPTVLSVGAVEARKGTLELVRALAQVRASLPNVRGLIVGSLDMEPDTVEQVRAAIRDLDLGATVTLTGRTSPCRPAASVCHRRRVHGLRPSMSIGSLKATASR